MRLTNELLSAALSGLECQQREIEAKIAEIRKELGVDLARRGPAAANRSIRPELTGKGGGTSTWRDRIPGIDGATIDITSHGTSASDYPKKRNHTMSAAGRARIAAAQRKRWAAIKKAKKGKKAA